MRSCPRSRGSGGLARFAGASGSKAVPRTGLNTPVRGLLPDRGVASWDLARWQGFLSDGQRWLLRSAAPPGTAGPCQRPVCPWPCSTQRPTRPASPLHTLPVALRLSKADLHLRAISSCPPPVLLPVLPPVLPPRPPCAPAPRRSEPSGRRRESAGGGGRRVTVNIQPQESLRGGGDTKRCEKAGCRASRRSGLRREQPCGHGPS